MIQIALIKRNANGFSCLDARRQTNQDTPQQRYMTP